jgi:hypothetical protein
MGATRNGRVPSNGVHTMSSTPTPVRGSLPKSPANAKPARLFYVAAAVLLLALMLVGFQLFYFHGRAYPDRPLTPPIRTLIILHGVAMASWVGLFVVQTSLIAGRKVRVHMTLGWLSAALAACVVILGLKLAVDSARLQPAEMRIWTLSPPQFMAVPFFGIITFAAFVAIGIWKRKRPAIHRPMMLLALLAAMPAAVSRIDAISHLYVGTAWETIFGPFLGSLAVGLVLLLAKCLFTRSFDRWFATGFAVLALVSVLTMQVATTGAWEQFAGMLLG